MFAKEWDRIRCVQYDKVKSKCVKMKKLSTIYDEFLKAENVLIELNIEEYINIARKIIKNNQFQRNRVKNSTSIYYLLRNDLKKLCTIPTIVLALKGDDLSHDKASNPFDEVDNLMILDGLQRTYSLIEVYDELEQDAKEQFERFKNHLIRVELYVGISRTGILYRMLTLNTGQTPMTKRHEIEILYSDYLSLNLSDGVCLDTETSAKSSSKAVGTYNFNFAIEGFCSLLEGDESQLTKKDLLVTVQELEKVSQDDYKKDLFKHFLITYNALAKKLDELTDSWVLNKVIPYKSIYAKSIPEFMNKAQTFSAFGAAVGQMSSFDAFSTLSILQSKMSKLMASSGETLFFGSVLEKMEYIKQHAKRIGDGQRLFLKYFFCYLFNADSSTSFDLSKSLDKAFFEYKKETENGTKL